MIANVYKLSPMQEGMLYHTLAEKESTAYFEQFVFTINGEISSGLLEKSFNILIQRYDVLRTIFHLDEKNRPLQVVLKQRKCKIETRDISQLSKEEQEAYLQDYMAEDKQRGFDLTRDLLMRITLIKTGPKANRLLWSYHHILMDGWCMGIIFKELTRIYYSLKNGEPVRLEPVTPYVNYIKWLEVQEKEQGIRYWREYLEGYEEQAHMRKFGEGEAGRETGYKVATYTFAVEEEIAGVLNRHAAENSATINMVLQTIWGILMQRYHHTHDVVYGAVVSGRPPGIEGVETMVGLFINTVPVRITLEGEKTYSQLLRQVQENAANSKPYEYLPLAEIQAQSALKNQLIDHILVFENYPVEKQVQENDARGNQGEFKLEVAEVKAYEQTHYSFNIQAAMGKRLSVTFNYNALEFEPGFIERLAGHMLKMMGQVAADPGILEREIEIVTPGEKRRVLEEFNGREGEYPRDRAVHELFSAQVERVPDHIALVGGCGAPGLLESFGGQAAPGDGADFSVRPVRPVRHVRLTYRELDERSGGLAHRLKEEGVGLDTIVGIKGERSVETIIGMLGILKAGGAYMPIDPDYPEERVNYMLADSGAKVLVSDRNDVGTGHCPVLVLDFVHAVYGEIGIQTMRTGNNSTGTGQCPVPTGSLGYVIYTSGTTGRPKGVMVGHGSLVNFIYSMYDDYQGDFGPGDYSQGLTNFCFDVSVGEIFMTLVWGAALVLLAEDKLFDPGALAAAIIRENITFTYIPPGLLKEVNDHLRGKGGIRPALNKMLVGVEPIKEEVLESYQALNPRMRIVNGYGPTEATICATAYKYCTHLPEGKRVPIGKPLANDRVLLLDKRGHLVPVGIPGEIVISGEGIARGYLNRPELTAEKFIEIYFYRSYRSNKSYIICYRTGDLAKWQPEGNIIFIGRIDQQVKIRGYRVEMGEIESRILGYEGVRGVAVMARETRAGQRYLCAYIAAEKDWSELSLREYLTRYLPGYMIPSYYVPVERIPVTAHGKVDRRALPEPGTGAAADGDQAPRDEEEEKLAAVWAEVLGRGVSAEAKKIGIDDNFFAEGGDSIKALQIAARMQKYGYKLEIKDIFARPTIRLQRKVLQPVKVVAEQSPEEGEVPLTPIQRWFYERNFAHPHHFNQAVMVYRPGGFEEHLLRRVLQKITEHHDALRMVFEKPKTHPGKVIQRNRGIGAKAGGELFTLEVFDNKQGESAAEEKRIQEEAGRIQAAIDLEKGPLVKVGLFKTTRGDHLLIVIHHLVVDGVSWRILLEDLAEGYRQAMKNEPLRYPPKTDSFKKWADKLREYAESPSLSGEMEYWKRIEETPIPPLPVEIEVPDGEKKMKNLRTLQMKLEPEATRQLLREVSRAYNTEVQDILLAALGQAIREWTGQDRVLLHMEGHGREGILEGIDVGRTVGWYTSQYPVLLEMEPGRDLSYTIKQVKETLRRIPQKGIGYGILKYLAPPEKKAGNAFTPTPGIAFNYLGDFGDGERGSKEEIFRESEMKTGPHFSPGNEQLYTLSIDGLVARGQLVISFSYNQNQYRQTTMERLVDSSKAHLLAIISHCVEKEARELTPSDLTYPHLAVEQLETLIRQRGDIEDIYELSPMQAGMLYHTLKEENTTAYVEQMVFTIEGEIDRELMRKSFQMLVERYDILRTCFYYETADQPLQIVMKHGPGDIYYEDSRSLGRETEAQNRALEQFYRADREKGFDLTKGRLIRLMLLKTGETQTRAILTFHHILMDGWCTGIIFKELTEIYRCLKRGEPVNLGPAAQYRGYIRWLKRQEKEAGLAYWRASLEGYEEQAGQVPRDRQPASLQETPYHPGKLTITVNPAVTDGINRFNRENQVTVNTIIQVVWGLLLQRYNDTRDVVYGAVVSGRPPEIEGIEQMVGLFINTVPVRIKTHDRDTFYQQTKDRQADAVKAKTYEYLPLVEIQAQSVLKRELIRHILVFENYPLEKQVKEAAETPLFSVRHVEVHEQTNYDFNIVVELGKQWTVNFVYNARLYSNEYIERISGHFQYILEQVAANPHIREREIEIVPGEERRRLLLDFNNTAAAYPGEETIHGLFARQVEQNPDHIALEGEKLQNTKYKLQTNSKLQITNNQQNGALRADVDAFGGKAAPDDYPSHPVRPVQPVRLVQLTYDELNERSGRLAHTLKERGVQPDTIVAIMMEASVDMIIGILGILKAGGAYMPIDPAYPEERVNYMLKDSKPVALLTTSTIEETLNRSDTSSMSYISPGDTQAFGHRPPATAVSPSSSTLTSTLTCQVGPANLAYVIYTSGSTGKPKGVMVDHRSLVNLCYWHNRNFSVTGGDRAGKYAGVGFDASVWEIFPYLVCGAALCIIEETVKLEIPRLNRYIEKHCLTISFLPTQVCEQFMAVDNRSLRLLLTGGDRLRHYEKRHYRLVNNYGPTENTVVATSCEVESDGREIPIGKPIFNNRVYILSRGGHLQPVGIPGEICIGGDGVARGYLNRPELTAKKFCLRRPGGSFWKNRPLDPCKNFLLNHSPLTTHHSPIYKSGDLARWQADGKIYFLGRIDEQVKIRGYRIELGEIENRLLGYKGIKEAVVTAREGVGGEKSLCAYYVSERAVPVPGIREYLSKGLPEYMIPAYFESIGKIPLTVNGKVDRKALPEPGYKKSDHYSAPQKRIEKKLVKIWAQVLGRGTGQASSVLIGIDDNFFELGGHSLKVTAMATRIFETFKVRIPLVEIFNNPTIRALSKRIGEKTKESNAALGVAEKREYYPLSPAQMRLYILQQMEEGNVAYNMPQIIPLEKGTDMKRLERAFREMIARHESLRTSFQMVGNEPVQRVHEEVEFEIESKVFGSPEPFFQKGSCSSETAFPLFRGQMLSHKLTLRNRSYNEGARAACPPEALVRNFDLTRAPLLRVKWLPAADRQDRLFIDMHHIISDGTSQMILRDELMSLYAGRTLTPLKLQYKDYVLWQNHPKNRLWKEVQEAYWLEVYTGEIPVLNLPIDYPRPVMGSFAGSTVDFQLEPGETRGIKEIARENQVTLFMAILAAFTVLLARLGGGEDIIVGTPVAGRRQAGLERIIGMFVDTLALRNYPGGHKTFKEFLQEVKESSLEAFENQEYPFDELVKKLPMQRQTRRNPLFDVMFNLLNQFEYSENPPGTGAQFLSRHRKSVSKFDMTLTVIDLGERLYCAIEYSTELFKPATIDRVIAYFKKILALVTGDSDREISGLEILSEAEKNRLLEEFNDTAAAYPGEKSLYELFVRQATQAPDRIIVIGTGHRAPARSYGVRERGLTGVSVPPCARFPIPGQHEQQISYGELNRAAQYLSHELRAGGVKPETIVAVRLETSIEMVIGILGILKAGGAYMPIDPEYPQERVDYMLKDSNPVVFLTVSTVEEVLDRSNRSYMSYKSPGDTPASLAYVIYTSGTTGRPKGVMVAQHSVIRLVQNPGFITFSPWDRILQTGALSFDASTFEIWGALLNGVCLCLISKDDLVDPLRMKTVVREKDISIMWMTAPLFNRVVQEEIEIFKGLKTLLVGGDVLSPTHIRRVKEAYPGLTVINGYGPTENTTFSTTHRIEMPISGSIPIGRPIANSTAYILDKYLRPVPVGVPGELVVGGDGVARGYMNNPELTAEKFIESDWLDRFNRSDRYNRSYRSNKSYIKLYQTGDLARWKEEGIIEFLGRQDNQVKIRGNRVEPGEIEHRLLEHPQVREVVVVPFWPQEGDREEGEKALCAYIVPGGEEKPDLSEIRGFLAAQVPGYMVPGYFVIMERIPLTPNGKVDRNRLPEPGLQPGQNPIGPQNDIEKKLVEIWAEVLGRETGPGTLSRIGVQDDFFEMGGHSLKATVLTAKIYQGFQVKITLSELFSNPTIEKMAARIAGGKGVEKVKTEPLKEAEFYELTYNQKRLWVLNQLEPDSPAYHMPGQMEWNHEVEAEAVKKSLAAVMQRHESLRTGFKLVDDEPVQFILKEVELPFQAIDLSTLDEEKKTKEKRKIYKDLAAKPFRLETPPLFRCLLVKLDHRHYEFLFNVHHIISDGWSMEILKRDFSQYYEGNRRGGEVNLPAVGLRYIEFAAMQNRQLQDPGFKKEAHDFWKKRVSPGIPGITFHGTLKGDSSDKSGAGYQCFIPTPLKEKLKKIALENRTSLFMVMFSVYKLFLTRFTGSREIASSIISAGRNHPALYRVMGFFINSIIYTGEVDERESYKALLQRTTREILEIFEYQSYPLEWVFEELRMRYPEIPVSFNMLNLQEATAGYELPSFEPMHFGKTQEVKFQLEPYITEYKNGIQVYWAYQKNLFTPAAIEYMAGEYIKLLDYFSAHMDSTYSEYRDQGKKPTFKRKKDR